MTVAEENACAIEGCPAPRAAGDRLCPFHRDPRSRLVAPAGLPGWYLITYGEDPRTGQTDCVLVDDAADLERQLQHLIADHGVDPETIRVWQTSPVHVVRVEQPKYVVEGLPVSEPTDRCTCGHTRNQHAGGVSGRCLVARGRKCGCNSFVPIPRPATR